jgi:hypothetical protein
MDEIPPLLPHPNKMKNSTRLFCQDEISIKINFDVCAVCIWKKLAV